MTHISVLQSMTRDELLQHLAGLLAEESIVRGLLGFARPETLDEPIPYSPSPDSSVATLHSKNRSRK
jgi:hypothetical protein